jgi:hypothetical protein
MAVSSARVTVTTTPTALNPVDQSGATLTIRNGATVIDLGPVGVATGAGYSLAASGTVVVAVDGGEQLYGVTGAGTSVVEVLRT